MFRAHSPQATYAESIRCSTPKTIAPRQSAPFTQYAPLWNMKKFRARRLRGIGDPMTALEKKGYRELPFETVEVSDLSPDEVSLYGLEGLEGLEGWKVFKKIGRAFKKIGKKIKKLKIKSVFKIAAPILATGGILGIGKIAAGTLLKHFGPKVAGLVQSGQNVAQKVMYTNGQTGAALLNAAQAAIVRQAGGDPNKAMSADYLASLGIDVNSLAVPGADVANNMLQLPAVSSTPQITASTLTPGTKKTPWPMIAAGVGALAVVLSLTGKRR